MAEPCVSCKPQANADPEDGDMQVPDLSPYMQLPKKWQGVKNNVHFILTRQPKEMRL